MPYSNARLQSESAKHVPVPGERWKMYENKMLVEPKEIRLEDIQLQKKNMVYIHYLV
jgi:hypothetical protein